jgi:hypothetical protein
MTIFELPLFVRDLFNSRPNAGEGINNWLFRAARVLHPYRNESEIFALLKNLTHGCGRFVSDQEILNAINHSKACAWNPNNPIPYSAYKQPKWPNKNEEQIEAITKDFELVDLWELSPIRFDNDKPHTEEIIDALFPKNCLLCVGKGISNFRTAKRDQLRGTLTNLSHIVPSPMSKPMGITKNGKESAHSLDNTGERRFLVIEFDSGNCDQHAAILRHLGVKYAPLALAVHSGGKSLHGWFYCQGQPEEKLLRFMRYAVNLGADSALWTKSQFVRIPDGLRNNGNRQHVYFFSPNVVGGII